VFIRIIDSNNIEKILFNLKGDIISRVLDSAKENEFFVRKQGNSEFTFNKNKYYGTSAILNMTPITSIRNPMYVLDTNIGAIDTETYEDSDGIKKIYALGFKSNLDKSEKTFYISDYGYDSSKLVLKFIEEISRDKYSNVVFYCHNLGGYVVYFLLKVIKKQNLKDDTYKLTLN